MKLTIHLDTEPAIVRVTHDELSAITAKWLKRHSQNILIPNCATVALVITLNKKL